MLMPKRVKYRKHQRGRRKGVATSGYTLSFGEFGLQALGNGVISNVQIEASRITVARTLKGSGKLWIRVFPDKSITKKPAEVRMGKGKGAPVSWVSVVRRGRILFELGGIDESLAKQAMNLVSSKMAFRTRFITRKQFSL